MQAVYVDPTTNGLDTDDCFMETFAHLTPQEQIIHTNWKARKVACEYVTANPRQGKEIVMNTASKWVNESNASALEALLEALLAIAPLLNSSDWSVIEGGAARVALERGLTGRPRAQTAAARLLEEMVACDRSTVVCDAIITAFSHKTPKNRQVGLAAASGLLLTFGANPIAGHLKRLLSAAIPPASDANAAVRKEALQLFVTSLRVVGTSVDSLLKGLKDKQYQELQSMIEAEPDREPFVPKRTLANATPEPSAAMGASKRSIHFTDEVPVLSRLPKGFFSGVLDKTAKWQDRAALIREQLLPLISAERVRASDDFTELAKLFRELLNDPQGPLSSLAYKCVQALAQSLGAPFGGYTRFFVPSLFDKYKDKKTLVTEAVDGTLNALLRYGCCSLDALLDDLDVCLVSKVPQQRLAALKWLISLPAGAPNVSFERLAQQPSLARLLGDEKVEIREAAASLFSGDRKSVV